MHTYLVRRKLGTKHVLLYPPVKQVEAKTKRAWSLSKEGDEHLAPTFYLEGTGTYLQVLFT